MSGIKESLENAINHVKTKTGFNITLGEHSSPAYACVKGAVIPPMFVSENESLDDISDDDDGSPIETPKVTVRRFF